MNDLKSRNCHIPETEVIINVHFTNGDLFSQPVDKYSDAQEFIDWYRKPGRDTLYEFHCVSDNQIHLLRHEKITAVDVDGYIEPSGRSSRWYEKIVNKFRVWRMTHNRRR